ncbi:MAG: hypothetical protein AB7T27_10380 [Kiritimatiellia bacterium]
MQEWIWRDVRIEIPADWEMLQFSREREKGRCAFADRRQFRLELSWRQVKGAPDFPRMMSDYKSRLESRGELQDAQTFTQAGWHGLAGKQKNLEVSRFGNYFDDDKLLVEIVFLWPDRRDVSLEKNVLQSCRYAAPEKGFRICKAFGLACRIPEAYEFSACHVQPALASMIFTGPRKPAQIKFQRLGMVPQWMKHPLADWLKAQIPKDVEDAAFENTTANGHAVAQVQGRYRPKGLLIPKGLYRAEAWICPTDGRLYHAENICRPGEDFSVRLPDCCGGAP